MSDMPVSEPEDGAKPQDLDKSQEKPKKKTGRPRKPGAILDPEACLRGLSQLPGLITLGILKPGHANAMRAIFSEILKAHHAQQSRQNDQGLSNDDLRELARKNPEVLNLLQALLTDEQIQMVMDEVQGNHDGKA